MDHKTLSHTTSDSCRRSTGWWVHHRPDHSPAPGHSPLFTGFCSQMHEGRKLSKSGSLRTRTGHTGRYHPRHALAIRHRSESVLLHPGWLSLGASLRLQVKRHLCPTWDRGCLIPILQKRKLRLRGNITCPRTHPKDNSQAGTCEIRSTTKSEASEAGLLQEAWGAAPSPKVHLAGHRSRACRQTGGSGQRPALAPGAPGSLVTGAH